MRDIRNGHGRDVLRADLLRDLLQLAIDLGLVLHALPVLASHRLPSLAAFSTTSYLFVSHKTALLDDAPRRKREALRHGHVYDVAP
jgi:hypothetical protein